MPARRMLRNGAPPPEGLDKELVPLADRADLFQARGKSGHLLRCGMLKTESVKSPFPPVGLKTICKISIKHSSFDPDALCTVKGTVIDYIDAGGAVSTLRCLFLRRIIYGGSWTGMEGIGKI